MSSEPGFGSAGPQRGPRYKYERLRERLRNAIGSGELSGKLPGERELARRYDANAKTINKALSDLTTEGLLVRHVGRGTFVAGHDGQAGAGGDRVLTFGWVIPASGRYAYRAEILEHARRLVAAKGHRIERVDLPADAPIEVPPHLLGGSRLRGLDGLVVHSALPSIELLGHVHRQHLPVVLINHAHDRVKLPLIAPDHVQGAFELCQHLIQLGHRRIQWLARASAAPGAGEAAAGYRAAMQRYGLDALPARSAGKHLDWSEISGGGLEPTAILCADAELAVAVRGSAAAAGVEVPAQLSLSALCEPGDHLAGEHDITAYEVDPGRVAEWIAELLLTASPGQPARTVILPGRIRHRESTDTPPAPEPSLTGPTREAAF